MRESRRALDALTVAVVQLDLVSKRRRLRGLDGVDAARDAAIAREIAQEHASAAVDGPRANLARARLRRWDHHTSVVDLTWERDL